MRENAALNQWRVRDGRMASDDSFGSVGCFDIPHRGIVLQVIAGGGLGWDHVSVVPTRNRRPLYRTPTWEEMCFVKGLFFDADDCVVQFHPPRSEYRNAHEYCLHLWRPQHDTIPMPDPVMVA